MENKQIGTNNGTNHPNTTATYIGQNQMLFDWPDIKDVRPAAPTNNCIFVKPPRHRFSKIIADSFMQHNTFWMKRSKPLMHDQLNVKLMTIVCGRFFFSGCSGSHATHSSNQITKVEEILYDGTIQLDSLVMSFYRTKWSKWEALESMQRRLWRRPGGPFRAQ